MQAIEVHLYCKYSRAFLQTRQSVLDSVDCGSTATFVNSGTEPRTPSKRICTSL